MINKSLIKFFIFPLLLLIFIFKTAPVYADVVHRPYDPFSDRSECDAGDREVVCTYSSYLNGLVILDPCKKYDLNPSYYFLNKYGNYLGGNKIYCYRQLSLDQLSGVYAKQVNNFIINNLANPLILTLLIELPVFFFFLFRTRKQLGSVIFMNFITVPLLNLTLFFFPIGGLIFTLILELFIVFLETAILITFNRHFSMKKIFLVTLLANFISAISGLVFIL